VALFHAAMPLALMSAASFVAIDVGYSLSGRISGIYLLDAAFQLLLIAALAYTRWLAQTPVGGGARAQP
jgi:hypothetical protein